MTKRGTPGVPIVTNQPGVPILRARAYAGENDKPFWQPPKILAEEEKRQETGKKSTNPLTIGALMFHLAIDTCDGFGMGRSHQLGGCFT